MNAPVYRFGWWLMGTALTGPRWRFRLGRWLYERGSRMGR